MKHFVRHTAVFIPVCLIALLFSGCAKRPPAAAPAAPPPVVSDEDAKKTIVATVNGAEISLQSLRLMTDRMTAMGQHESAPAVPPEEIRKKALDQLVLQELALQEAARQGLQVDEMTVDKTMEQLIAKLGHEEGYRAFLETKHLTAVEFRSQVERSLLTQLIMNREIVAKAAPVSEEDVRKEYERQKDRLIISEKFAVVDVVLFLKQDDPESLKKAQGLIDRINAAKDRNPLELTPDGTFIAQETELNKDKEPALWEAARALKEGELSGVLHGSDSLHIIKLIQHSPERKMTYEEIRGSIEGTLKMEAMKKRRQEWEQELKKDAKIVLLDVPGQ